MEKFKIGQAECNLIFDLGGFQSAIVKVYDKVSDLTEVEGVPEEVAKDLKYLEKELDLIREWLVERYHAFLEMKEDENGE